MQVHGASAWCECMVRVHGASAWCKCLTQSRIVVSRIKNGCLLDAVGLSGILKAKQKLDVSFNFDK